MKCSQCEFVSDLICPDTNSPLVGNDNLGIWFEGENNITQTIDTRGLLMTSQDASADCACSITALLRKHGVGLPQNILENASCERVVKAEKGRRDF